MLKDCIKRRINIAVVSYFKHHIPQFPVKMPQPNGPVFKLPLFQALSGNWNFIKYRASF